MAPRPPGQPALGHDPRHRAFDRRHHRRHRTGPFGVPLGPGFAAWLGLVPRQHSTGGKERLGRISKQGNRSIRRLLIVGAHSALLRSKEIRASAWVQSLLGRCARLKVAVALANKTARIAWAMMAKGEAYRRPATAAAA